MDSQSHHRQQQREESNPTAQSPRQNQTWFRHIVENIQEVFWVRDLNTEEILYVSPSYEMLWGRPCDELYRNSDAFLETVHPDDVERVRAAKKSQSQEQLFFDKEYRIVRPDGAIRWIRSRMFPIQDESGNFRQVAGIAIDMTAYKQTEGLLRQRTAELAERVKELQCLYTLTEIVETPDMTLQEIFQRFVHQLPLAFRHPERIYARIVFGPDVFTTTPFQETAWKMCHAFIGNQNPSGRVEVYALQERPESDEDAFLQEEVWLLHVIAERLGKIILRKCMEATLLKSETQYRLLAEQVAHGIVIAQEGQIVFANTALADMFGYTPEQFHQKTPLDLICETYHPHFLETVKQITQGIIPPAFEVPCLTRERQEIWVIAHLSQIEWHGEPALLAVVSDITARKHQERATQQERDQLRQENMALKTTLKNHGKFGEMIGKSPAMQQVYERIEQAAATDATVLIQGETGVGKELVARTIHRLSARHNKPFIIVNCGAVSSGIFEREFFGHRKGVFTGAHQNQQGYLDAAHHGTLFLDEVMEFDPVVQVKLLRMLESGEYTPVGAQTTKHADVRIIAATNRDFEAMLHQGSLRADLYYRLKVVLITIPPLRNRQEDLLLLVEHFLSLYGKSQPAPTLPAAFLEQFYMYDWPGNVRQLQNVIQHYLATGQLELPASRKQFVPEALMSSTGGNLGDMLKQVEKQLITSALQQACGKKVEAAKRLGINRKTLYKKMRQHGLT